MGKINDEHEVGEKIQVLEVKLRRSILCFEKSRSSQKKKIIIIEFKLSRVIVTVFFNKNNG